VYLCKILFSSKRKYGKGYGPPLFVKSLSIKKQADSLEKNCLAE